MGDLQIYFLVGSVMMNNLLVFYILFKNYMQKEALDEAQSNWFEQTNKINQLIFDRINQYDKISEENSTEITKDAIKIIKTLNEARVKDSLTLYNMQETQIDKLIKKLDQKQQLENIIINQKQYIRRLEKKVHG